MSEESVSLPDLVRSPSSVPCSYKISLQSARHTTPNATCSWACSMALSAMSSRLWATTVRRFTSLRRRASFLNTIFLCWSYFFASLMRSCAKLWCRLCWVHSRLYCAAYSFDSFTVLTILIIIKVKDEVSLLPLLLPSYIGPDEQHLHWSKRLLKW